MVLATVPAAKPRIVASHRKSKTKHSSCIFPNIKIVIGTHQEHVTPEEYRERVKKLFCQPRKTMIDVILDKD